MAAYPSGSTESSRITLCGHYVGQLPPPIQTKWPLHVVTVYLYSSHHATFQPQILVMT